MLGFHFPRYYKISASADCKRHTFCKLVLLILPHFPSLSVLIAIASCSNAPLVCIGQMSSSTRQHFPLYHIQCRAQIDTLFYSVLCCKMSAFWILNVEVSCKMDLGQTVRVSDNNLDCARWKILFLESCNYCILKCSLEAFRSMSSWLQFLITDLSFLLHVRTTMQIFCLIKISFASVFLSFLAPSISITSHISTKSFLLFDFNWNVFTKRTFS